MYKIKRTCTFSGKWYKLGELHDTLPAQVLPHAEPVDAQPPAVKVTKVAVKATKDVKPKNTK
jgi:hypothetical protein